MSSLPLWSKSRNYDLADQEEDVSETERPKPSSRLRYSLRMRVLGIIALCMVWTYVIGTASFRAGEHHIVAQYEPNMNLRTVHHSFVYNDTFSESPTEHGDEPWRALFPEHGAYFKKASIHPERVTFSVFHQIHCVNRLRHGYWEARQAAKDGKELLDDDESAIASPKHIQHCLDYLRQSLMCHADTTIEPKDVKGNGAHGFGIQHNCRNWNQLLETTDKWVLGE